MEKIENVGRKKVRSIKWPIVLLFNDTALYQKQRTLKIQETLILPKYPMKMQKLCFLKHLHFPSKVFASKFLHPVNYYSIYGGEFYLFVYRVLKRIGGKWLFHRYISERFLIFFIEALIKS